MLRRHASLVLLLAALLWGWAASAAATVVDEEGWFQVTGTGPIAGSWRAFLEAQPRIGERPDDDGVGMRTMIARGAVGYEVAPGWSLWQGYGFVPNFNPYRWEHRSFQQSLWDTGLGPFALSNRTRFEQRWLEDAQGVSLRLRHQIRFAYPLPRWPAWSLVLADEAFVNFNTVTGGPTSGFDQNRLFAGVSRQLTPHVRVEVDYLNQIVNGRNGAENTLRNGGFMQLAFTW